MPPGGIAFNLSKSHFVSSFKVQSPCIKFSPAMASFVSTAKIV
jgi:hypothetical protein